MYNKINCDNGDEASELGKLKLDFYIAEVLASVSWDSQVEKLQPETRGPRVIQNKIDSRSH